MPRKKLYRTKHFPYHLTARVNNRENFPLPLADAWRFLTSELHTQALVNGFEVHALVLMPNHFHLIGRCMESDLSAVMQGFIGSYTRIINTRTQRSGRLFGSRYHWSVITNPIYYAHALKYVYRNPVKAKLCERVEDWSFSTITGLVGLKPLPLPVRYEGLAIQRNIPTDLWQQLDWLNTAYGGKEQEAIKKAFRRRLFKIPHQRSGKSLLLRKQT